MAVSRVLAFVGVGLIVIGMLAAAVAVSDPSPRAPLDRTGTGIPPSTRAGGRTETPLAGPSVAYTLVLLNNTLVPGNFLAGNGAAPFAVAYDGGKGEVFVANPGGAGSNSVTVISDATNAVVAIVPVGSNPQGVAYDSAKGEVFVANSAGMGSNTVSVISHAAKAAVADIPVRSNPVGGARDSGKGGGVVA